jgi:hypothetical protein
LIAAPGCVLIRASARATRAEPFSAGDIAMAAYRFAKDFVADPSSERWTDIIARAYAAHMRPVCLCATPAAGARVPAMYIAHANGKHVLKRMPFTGSAHAPQCDHYEAPPELSGRGQVTGAAVRENPEDGTTSLALDFALTKGAARAQPTPGTADHDSVRSDGTKLTLRAMLHYLLDEAGLTRWSPRMRDKRSWFVVRRELLAAAAAQRTKGKPLTDLLFIPEPWDKAHQRDIAARRARELRRLSESPGSRMLVIAPHVALEKSHIAARLQLKHLPDLHIQVSADLHKRIQERFKSQFALWDQLEGSHLLLIGTISEQMPGLYNLEEACFINVNGGWIPFEGVHEYELLEALADRRYVKGLRYNLPRLKPLASAVLQDTDRPTGLYILEPDADDEQRRALQALTEASELPAWQWDCGEGPMPALPTARAGPVASLPSDGPAQAAQASL